MKQVPNLITLLNLVCGIAAIVVVLENRVEIAYNADEQFVLLLQPKIYLASLLIGIAAVVDFLDGFVARWLDAESPMGKQLDSLSDVVSFGVAPALIIYQFLRVSIAHNFGTIDTSIVWLLPSFGVAMAAAYRLARFNISTNPSLNFVGVPVPAVGLFVASFPIIYWYPQKIWVSELLVSSWFWYGIIIFISYLQISRWPMLSLKTGKRDFNSMLPFIVLLAVAVVGGIFFKWLVIPLLFFCYVFLSLYFLKFKIRAV